MMESEEAPSNTVLLERCIPGILSVTSPREAARFTVISKTFNIAADSDSVWERFLPSDYRQIISKAVSPLIFDSKKQLYLLLSDSNNILLDRGYLAFKLDKDSGKKCFMLGARRLTIGWQNDSRYWKWAHIAESRFAEVAILELVCWLKIEGKIGTRMLSRKSTYVAYFVFLIRQHSAGLDVPAKTMVIIGGIRNETYDVYIQQRKRAWEKKLAPPPRSTMRKDGWMEIELGEFYSDDGDEVYFEMKFLEAKSWKTGLVVEGIEFRPKKSV